MALFSLEATIGAGVAVRPLVLVGIALVVAALWHRRSSQFWKASFRATFTSAVLFYLVALSGLFNLGPFTMHFEYFFLAEILHTDFLSAFWLAVLVSTLAVSFIIAVLVGWAMRLWRRRHPIDPIH